MNEWGRLADISTSTRRYLSKSEVQKINTDASAKMGKIERARRRIAAHENASTSNGFDRPLPSVPEPSNPMAVELPADEVYSLQSPQTLQSPQSQYSTNTSSQRQSWYQQSASPDDKFMVVSSDEYPQPAEPQQHNQLQQPPRSSAEIAYRGSAEHQRYPSSGHSPQLTADGFQRSEPPPLPPKTPIQIDTVGGRPRPPPAGTNPRTHGNIKLPYPDVNGPPPVVNMSRKPEYVPR